MYDGLSKNDLRIILAHQMAVSNPFMPLSEAIERVNKFLGHFEALSAEPESHGDDGEGEGTRDA